MRDGRIGLIILAAGIAPAIIKKSKPMARYVGDQLIRAGEYMKHGTDEATAAAPATQEPEAAAAANEVPQAEDAGKPPVVEASKPAEAKPKQAKKNGKGA
jgi:hypothetical protein